MRLCFCALGSGVQGNNTSIATIDKKMPFGTEFMWGAHPIILWVEVFPSSF